jgi:hypothetical protein
VIDLDLLIPVADNSGVPFDPTYDAVFETELNRLFGGHTRMTGDIVGQWVEGGQTFKDTHRVYRVRVAGLIRNPEVAAVIDFAKQHYAQLAIYVRYLGQSEIL